MTNYGPRHTIQDQYGQDLQVSSLTPDQARNLAKQLEAVAEEAESYGN
jgi:hypothetical protein